MAIMEISLFPIGTESTSMSDYVADALKAIREEEGIQYELTPTGTVIVAEEVSTLFQAAQKMQNTVFQGGARRVITNIRIDNRKDREVSLNSQIESVKEKLKEN